jgi:hypothetical protein
LRVSRPMVGAGSGLLLAALLVLAVGIAGGGSVHLDLVKAAVAGTASNGGSSQTGLGGSSVSPPSVQSAQVTTSTSAASSHAAGSLSGLGGTAAGYLLLPIALGAALGAVFYGTYSRRVDSE